MIIWLASYPKSGNTYVRAFLSAYYFSNNGQFDFSQISNIDQFPHEKFFNQKVNNLIILEVSAPDILITAIPEIPGPEESAKIVINYYYSYILSLII